jgi:hypothetical protein
LVSSWQQQRIYRIRPSRLNRLSSAGGRLLLLVVVAVAAAAADDAASVVLLSPPPVLPLPLLQLLGGLLRQASISGKHPPTQWL